MQDAWKNRICLYLVHRLSASRAFKAFVSRLVSTEVAGFHGVTGTGKTEVSYFLGPAFVYWVLPWRFADFGSALEWFQGLLVKFSNRLFGRVG